MTVLSNARWPEVAAGPRRLLVVPLGSVEQHGPHLPMYTDTRIAVAVASRACAGRPEVGIAPAVTIGAHRLAALLEDFEAESRSGRVPDVGALERIGVEMEAVLRTVRGGGC